MLRVIGAFQFLRCIGPGRTNVSSHYTFSVPSVMGVFNWNGEVPSPVAT